MFTINIYYHSTQKHIPTVLTVIIMIIPAQLVFYILVKVFYPLHH